MIKEFLNSISNNLNERISSPLLSSYTIAAIICNWMPIVVLLTSESKGIKRVAEIESVYPGVIHSIIYPLIFSISFSLLYPSLKAFISKINTKAKIMELENEYRVEELKGKVNIKKDIVESFIHALSENTMEVYDSITYHQLKKILDALPKSEDLLIKEEKPRDRDSI
ncbi:hypothetical protein [Serratia aquatilis]|uniref:Uncharacterized protein n=1 Tax=Serratia aquatilis TaxID=1737515 RepID=A0ABV6E7X6_9GAMM